MSGSKHGRGRGYVLAEALVGGVVMMLALVGVFGALSRGGEHVGRAVADQDAAQRATEQLEWLRAQPPASPAWAVGTTKPCQGLQVELPTGWKCTVTVTQVTDTAVAAPVSGFLSYKRAVVLVEYRGTSLSLEALRW
jgi:Tfp pilus assembly protein PilV